MSKIYFDAETIPDQREGALARAIAEVKPPGQYKKQESIDKWMDENAATAGEESYAKTGLNGLYGEICSISYAIDDQPVQTFMRDYDTTEAEIIVAFELALSDLRSIGEGSHHRLEWIGHNVLDFDLRFLKQRAMVNRIPMHVPADAKHGNGSVFDTMKEWAGFRGFVSQDALCEAFGLPTKPGMTGADVWPAWKAGEFDRITAYNQYDVETVRKIHKIMVGDYEEPDYARVPF